MDLRKIDANGAKIWLSSQMGSGGSLKNYGKIAKIYSPKFNNRLRKL